MLATSEWLPTQNLCAVTCKVDAQKGLWLHFISFPPESLPAGADQTTLAFWVILLYIHI